MATTNDDTSAVRTYCEFRADTVDDAQWDDSGELSRPPGRWLARRLSEVLSLSGAEIDAVRQHKWYGWQIDCRRGRYRFCCILQGGEPWLLITVPKRQLWCSIGAGSYREDLRSLCIDIHRALHEHIGSVNRSTVRWYTADEYDNRCIGATAPVDDSQSG